VAECSRHPGNPLPGCYWCRNGLEPPPPLPREYPQVENTLTSQLLKRAGRLKVRVEGLPEGTSGDGRDLPSEFVELDGDVLVFRYVGGDDE
jgi:hypothetical protein